MQNSMLIVILNESLFCNFFSLAHYVYKRIFTYGMLHACLFSASICYTNICFTKSLTLHILYFFPPKLLNFEFPNSGQR